MNPTVFRQFGIPRLQLPRSASIPSIVFASILILVGSTGFGQSDDSLDKDYSGELPRFEPLSPKQAIESMKVLDGFRVELVASEPLVVDPIAFAFDARSRLFVVEMRDYSEQDKEHLGRIALLTDSDGDGRMDHRSTFVDGLSWPTAIHPWRDGVIVAAPPKMTWFRDTNDDGKADTSEVWFEGFGRSNVQGMTNSLRWGVDCFLHGATSSTDANLRSNNQPAQTLRRTDFAIDTLRTTLHPVSGGGQHGLSFNRWGDKFVTSNSDHLQQIVDMHGWLASHRPMITMPSLRRSIAIDGKQAEVFRASPVEPWRVVRTRLRVGGIVGGPVEG
ncbi:MAG: PVC-type heme-binding CxxCH protein, partial [Planctomycetota bacterium]